MDKEWYKSKTVWGAVLLFLSGALHAIGATGWAAVLATIAGLLGVPLTVIGFRSAIGKIVKK